MRVMGALGSAPIGCRGSSCYESRGRVTCPRNLVLGAARGPAQPEGARRVGSARARSPASTWTIRHLACSGSCCHESRGRVTCPKQRAQSAVGAPSRGGASRGARSSPLARPQARGPSGHPARKPRFSRGVRGRGGDRSAAQSICPERSVLPPDLAVAWGDRQPRALHRITTLCAPELREAPWSRPGRLLEPHDQVGWGAHARLRGTGALGAAQASIR